MTHLTIEQRYEIATLRSQGFSMSNIGEFIGRDKSVISREPSRNSDKRNQVHKAALAQSKTYIRHREKPKKIYFTNELNNE